ncbi:hypothetical protein GGI35DRAFT_165027 [Trichoderma velutinum]
MRRSLAALFRAFVSFKQPAQTVLDWFAAGFHDWRRRNGDVLNKQFPAGNAKRKQNDALPNTRLCHFKRAALIRFYKVVTPGDGSIDLFFTGAPAPFQELSLDRETFFRLYPCMMSLLQAH